MAKLAKNRAAEIVIIIVAIVTIIIAR